MKRGQTKREIVAEDCSAPSIPARSSDPAELRLYRYTGRVLFSTVDGENSTCYGEFPFQFMADYSARMPADSLRAESQALALSEGVYDDPRVDAVRTVVFDSIEEVGSQRIHLDLVVHVSFETPSDGDPEELAAEFVTECDYAFSDGTGQAFNVETEIREHELAGVTA